MSAHAYAPLTPACLQQFCDNTGWRRIAQYKGTRQWRGHQRIQRSGSHGDGPVACRSRTLGADRQHVWTAEAIFPALADEYRQLRKTLGKCEAPLNVIVSGGGKIDLRLPIFTSDKLPTMIITTTEGTKLLSKQDTPDTVEIRATRHRGKVIPAATILDEVCRVNPGKSILVEGGPRLLGDFYAERLINEQFLTLAPQIAGRDTGDERPSLVMGKTFAPRDALWGSLIDMRRGSSHLFLRYSFP